MNLRKRGKLGTILRPLLNFIGLIQGYSSCMCCGDSWYWKSTDKISDEISMFPVCDECWEKMAKEKKHEYIDRLAEWWKDMHPLTKENLEEIRRAHEIVEDLRNTNISVIVGVVKP